MKRFFAVVALAVAGLVPAAVAAPASASVPHRCGASAVLVSQTDHETTVRKTDSCYSVRAFIASSKIGYIFGPWVSADGATSKVSTTKLGTGGGYETSAGRINKLWGSYIK